MADAYKVRKIIPVPRIDADGQLRTVNRIEATTTLGTQFTVEVPESDTTVKNVKDLLLKKAKELDGILQL